jgi:ACS family pantothenate transporter-like MFS transporter
MIAACHTATSYFNLWLKAEGYSVSKINYLPTGGNALAIVVTLAWGMIADRTGQFYWLVISLQFLMILSNILLSVWTIPKSALLFAYYISYAGSAATPVLIVSRPLSALVQKFVVANRHTQAWAVKLNAGDPNLRQLLVAVANVISYTWVLWVPCMV